ncbi:MAG: cation:proton antiporter [Candidatus Pacearchaeota archaeon]
MSLMFNFFKNFFSAFQTLTQSQTILISIALLFIIAAILAFIFRALRQELVLVYIVTGIIIGPLVFGLIPDKTTINGFAEIGISLLLFFAGLEINLKKFKETTGISIVVGILQVAIVSAISYFLLIHFGFLKREALILGLAISFSSTIVVLKLLSDKNEIDSLKGRLVIGIMLVQDLIAIAILAFISGTPGLIGINLIKLAFLFLLCFLASYPIKKLIEKTSSSGEYLFLFSLASLFFFVTLAHFLQLSIAIGAFGAGLILASTPYKLDIEAKVKSLKDFFCIIFFVFIGMWLTRISKSILLPLIPAMLILIFIEPLITAMLLRIRGYKSKLALDIGFAFGQLSEFTLILGLYALSISAITQPAFDLIVLMAVISIALTPYTMKLSRAFYGPFKVFDKLPLLKEPGRLYPGKKTILLIGCHRMGSVFIKNLEKYKERIVVIDFNPTIIKALSDKGISAFYGDITEIDILDKLPLNKLKVVISTIPTKESNISLTKYFKQNYPNVFVVVTAHRIDDAIELYNAGADFVIMPLIMGAEHSIEMIKKLSKKQFKLLKKQQIDYLKELHRILY